MSKYSNDLSNDVKEDDVINETSAKQEFSENVPDSFPEDTTLNKENAEMFKEILKQEWNITKEFMGMVEKAGDNQFG